MTGPEHYREAERLLDLRADEGVAPETTLYRAALAQVHATLALAAATALSGASPRLPDWNAWRDTAGTQPEMPS